MIKVGPLDMVFLLIENATLRAHMTAFMIFEKPKGQQASFGPRLVEAYRKRLTSGEIGFPWSIMLEHAHTDVR